MKYLFACLVVFSCFTSTFSQEINTCTLKVRVDNIKNIEGSIKIALYNDKDDFLSEEVVLTDGQKIAAESVEFFFDGLGEGYYAISLFHDKNDNDELDANFIGIPTEPYAFSNNARGRFGPPSFEECKFSLSLGSKEITISL